MDRVKINHYVPQFYLKNFSTKRGKNYSIHCFDKLHINNFPTNISKIGAEGRFYDPSLEKMLSKFESNFNIAYLSLIRKKEVELLTDEEKNYIATFVATQLIRTKEFREIIRDLINQVTDKLAKEKLSKELNRQTSEAQSEQVIRSLHDKMFTQLPLFTKIILDMKWILFMNKSNLPLWTSDHPVTLFNPINHEPFGNLGLSSKGIQIHFPLTNNLSLIICDPITYSELPSNLEANDDENIIYENSLQVYWSTRHIFSQMNDFSLAKSIIKEDSSLKEINRKRWNVTLGGK